MCAVSGDEHGTAGTGYGKGSSMHRASSKKSSSESEMDDFLDGNVHTGESRKLRGLAYPDGGRASRTVSCRALHVVWRARPRFRASSSRAPLRLAPTRGSQD